MRTSASSDERGVPNALLGALDLAIQGSYAPALHSFDPTQQQSCTFFPSGGLAPILD